MNLPSEGAPFTSQSVSLSLPTNLLNKSLGVVSAFQYFTIMHPAIYGHDLAVVEETATPEPAYVNNKRNGRADAQSKELHGLGLVGYVRNHWS